MQGTETPIHRLSLVPCDLLSGFAFPTRSPQVVKDLDRDEDGWQYAAEFQDEFYRKSRTLSRVWLRVPLRMSVSIRVCAHFLVSEDVVEVVRAEAWKSWEGEGTGGPPARSMDATLPPSFLKELVALWRPRKPTKPSSAPEVFFGAPPPVPPFPLPLSRYFAPTNVPRIDQRTRRSFSGAIWCAPFDPQTPDLLFDRQRVGGSQGPPVRTDAPRVSLRKSESESKGQRTAGSRGCLQRIVKRPV